MLLLHGEGGEEEVLAPQKGGQEMPKLILAAAALLLRRPFPPPGAEAHEAMHARTRSRGATRRQRASRMHDPYFDLSPLELTKRH
jgi:hypothetical protein